MNARVHASRSPVLSIQFFSTARQRLLVFCLTLLVFVSALLVVLASDEYRMCMLEQEQVVSAHQVLMQNNQVLRLEVATGRAQASVARKAKALGMYVPTKRETVWLTMRNGTKSSKE